MTPDSHLKREKNPNSEPKHGLETSQVRKYQVRHLNTTGDHMLNKQFTLRLNENKCAGIYVDCSE